MLSAGFFVAFIYCFSSENFIIYALHSKECLRLFSVVSGFCGCFFMSQFYQFYGFIANRKEKTIEGFIAKADYVCCI